MDEANLATVAEDAKVAYTYARSMWRTWRDEKDKEGRLNFDNLKKLSQHLNVWSRDAEQALVTYQQQLKLAESQQDSSVVERCRTSLYGVEATVQERMTQLATAARPDG